MINLTAMRTLILLSCIIFSSIYANAQIYSTKNGIVSFFSEAPLENIEAVSNVLNSFMNTTTGEVVFIVPITSFKFEKDLMREHFNENYMESDKYPQAIYKGKINEKIDFSKDGTYEVTCTGKLTIHGVEKERTEKGTLTIKGEKVSLESSFSVLVKDFNIEIPKLVFENIAETILIKVSSSYTPYLAKTK